MSFTAWLQEIAPVMGGERAGAPPLGPKLAEVRRSLEKRRAENELYFRIVLALALVLAVTTIVAAVLLRCDQGKDWVTGTFGVSAFGAVVFAVNLVREKRDFDIMIGLSLGLNESAMLEVLSVLLRKYAGNVKHGPAGSAAELKQKA